MTPNLPQKRKAVTDSERLAIRKRQKEHPSIHKELIEWFEQQRGHQLVPSQITQILSSKYAYLNELDPKSKQDNKKLERSAKGWESRLTRPRGSISRVVAAFTNQKYDYHKGDTQTTSNKALECSSIILRPRADT